MFNDRKVGGSNLTSLLYFILLCRNGRRGRRTTRINGLVSLPPDSLVFCPSGIQRRQSADLRRPSPTVEEPAPAPLRGPAAAADASHPLTEARGAGETRSWTSPSTRPSTPREERPATSWTKRSGRGEAGVRAAVWIREDGRVADCNREAPSGPGLNSMI